MSALLEFIRSRRNDRGMMAVLKCALTNGKRHRAWPVLGRFNAIGDSFEHVVMQTIAGLYAMHPEEGESGNIGALCRKIADRRNEKREDISSSISARVQHLLQAERHEICDRVVRIVLYAKSQSLPVDYDTLENDLRWWGPRVKNRWASSFWGSGGEQRVEE